jgi:SAM-dependent methyltransferase
MCNATGIAFGERVLTQDVIADRDVLEVGAFDVNGSIRPHTESLKPRSYVGVDIADGPRVDRVLDARQLVETFGRESFDVVITTEMVEHVRDWRTVVSNLKGVLRPGGHLLVTTRSAGFPYHGWPYDFWRYEREDMERIFGDLDLLAVEPDTASPGIFVFGRRPEAFTETTPDLALMSIVTGRRQRRVTNAQIAWFRAMSLLEPAVKGTKARRARVARAVGRRRIRPKHLWATVKRRIVGPAWRALPRQARTSIKRALGREPAR